MFSGRIGVVGAGGGISAAFVARATGAGTGGRLVVVDAVAPAEPTTEFRHASGPDAVAAAVADCDAVVYFGVDAPCGPDAATRAGAAPAAPDIVDAVEAALAARPGPTRLVVLSSAQAYGAWANNPVPLTEAAPLRPNEGAPDVARLAEIERRLGTRDPAAGGPEVTVLRAATVLGPAVWAESCAELLDQGRVGAAGGRPVRQFVHVDDVAGAAWHCLEFGLSGVYNVASEGWLTPEEVDAMARRRGPVVKLRPDEYRRWLELVKGTGRVGAARVARDLYPCVISTTRLSSGGFRPGHTNAEVLGVGLDAAARWHTQVKRSRRAVRTPLAVGAAAVLGALWLGRRRH